MAPHDDHVSNFTWPPSIVALLASTVFLAGCIFGLSAPLTQGQKRIHRHRPSRPTHTRDPLLAGRHLTTQVQILPRYDSDLGAALSRRARGLCRGLALTSRWAESSPLLRRAQTL